VLKAVVARIAERTERDDFFVGIFPLPAQTSDNAVNSRALY
jgi:hypothetical protein